MKKNVWLWRSGPPIVPPNWLRLNGGVSSCDPHSFVFMWPSRRYSNADPLNALVPDLVSTLITPLEKRPYSTL